MRTSARVVPESAASYLFGSDLHVSGDLGGLSSEVDLRPRPRPFGRQVAPPWPRPADYATWPGPATQSPPTWWQALIYRRWPLLIVLLIQAALSARLIWANSAFTDEALYLWSGHMEWTHWLYGARIPEFQTYFSGAPVIYPPLGALADSIGGLAAARALSLVFMLGATVLLHGTTRRIFNRSAALFAAALFAGIGATEYLGAFATYDAMALVLMALATWLGVMASTRQTGRGVFLLTAAGVILAVANATKYASALFDPVVILTVLLLGWQRRSWKAGVRAAVIVVFVTSLAAAAAWYAGGAGYWRGVTFTTLTRQTSTSSPSAILIVSLGWAGFVGGLAILGVVIVLSRRPSWPHGLLGVTLAGAVWLAPAEQARIHTFASLFKHVGFGEWFGAIVAGLALASLASAVPRVKVGGAFRAGLAAAAASTIIGALLAGNQFTTWPNASRAIKTLSPLVSAKGSVLAADNGNVIEYYLPAEGTGSAAYFIDGQAQWQAIFSGNGFNFLNPATGQVTNGVTAYDLAVRRRYFSVIALSNYHAWVGADSYIRKDIAKYGGYRLAVALPYTAGGIHATYQIWVRKVSA